LVSGIGGAVAGGVKYYVKNPWPTYFFMIYWSFAYKILLKLNISITMLF
jgi:hypothetical protein